MVAEEAHFADDRNGENSNVCPHHHSSEKPAAEVVPGAGNSAVAEVPVENCSKKPELKAMFFSRHLTAEAQLSQSASC